MTDIIPSVRYEAKDGIAFVTFANASKMNAMTFDMWSSLPKLIARAEQDAEIRLIVVSGDGDKAFCAGADISEFGERRTGESAVAKYNAAVAAGSKALAGAAKPTVAIIRGICIGGGFALAMCCDLRLATDDSKFRIPAARLGLGYESASIATLVAKIGIAGVADLLLSANTLYAQDALRYGIVNRVWPRAEFEAATTSYVSTMAGNAPLTMQAVKQALVELMRPGADRDFTLADAMVSKCFASEDYREGQSAFREKRPPVFKGQ